MPSVVDDWAEDSVVVAGVGLRSVWLATAGVNGSHVYIAVVILRSCRGRSGKGGENDELHVLVFFVM